MIDTPTTNISSIDQVSDTSCWLSSRGAISENMDTVVSLGICLRLRLC